MEDYDKLFYKVMLTGRTENEYFLTKFSSYKFKRLVTIPNNNGTMYLYIKVRGGYFKSKVVPVIVKKIDKLFEDPVTKEKLDLNLVKLNPTEKYIAGKTHIDHISTEDIFWTSSIPLLSVKYEFASLNQMQLNDYAEGIEELRHFAYRVYIETKTHVQEIERQSLMREQHELDEVNNALNFIDTLSERFRKK